jgi:hypothetical protein
VLVSEFEPSATREPDIHCTSPQRNTHIPESRIVHYPWHPWRGRSVFIDERVEKNGRVLFRCRVEETRQWCGLEIPDWMFDSACGTVCPVDAPAVGYEALRSLKVLLTTASNHDPIVKEAQGFEGGTDANDTESKTISIRTVPSINSDPPMGSNTIGVEAKGDPVTVTIVPPALGESTRPPEQGGRP